MANLIIITGPQAVGKMSVAKVLSEKIKYCMMKNHDSIEISDLIFKRGTEAQKECNKIIRKDIFDIAIKYNQDLIFTFVTAFDQKEDIEYLNNLKNTFENTGGNFYFIELKTDLETRLKRNVTPERLAAKPSKREIEFSNKELLDTNKKYKLNTDDNEKIFEHHLKIDNTNLSPEEVTKIIIEYLEDNGLNFEK